jgi:hypothetical protein
MVRRPSGTIVPLKAPSRTVSWSGSRVCSYSQNEGGVGVNTPHTFSNGTWMSLFLSSHSGTGRFLLRMKAGLKSFD